MAAFRKWRVDFEEGAGRHVVDPPGYSATARDSGSVATTTEKRKENETVKRQAYLMAKARAPFKQVAFMCFMMYMSGTTIQIFSLMMTISGIAGPIQAMLKSGEVFPEDPQGKLDTFSPRVVYCIIHIAQLGFALNRLNAMGLMPTHASDWVSALVVPRAQEFSSGGIGLD